MEVLSNQQTLAVSGGFSLFNNPELDKLNSEYSMYYGNLGLSMGSIYGMVQAGGIFNNSNLIFEYSMYGCGLGHCIGSTIALFAAMQNNDS